MDQKNIYIVAALIVLAVVIVWTIYGGNGITTKIEGEELEQVYTDVNPEEARQLIDNTPNLVIIDVSPNYDEGHLPGAVNYYVGDGTLDSVIPTLDKDTPYLVYCHFESASRLGAQKLADAGFTNVYRLNGDYSGWVGAGYPIEQ